MRVLVFILDYFSVSYLYSDLYLFNFDSLNYSLCCLFNRSYSSKSAIASASAAKGENKFSNMYKKEYGLSQYQREALIGVMLADGNLDRGKPTYNTRLRIDHTYPDQESYVLSLHALFGSMIAMEPTIVTRKSDPRTGKVYQSIYVRTLRFACLNPYHDLFYKDKKKVVPSNIQDLLTPVGLAHIIMGDGFLNGQSKVVIICSESFSKEEQELLISVLDKNFGIKATLNKRVSTLGNET